MAEASEVLYGEGDDELRQVRDTVAYIGEQVAWMRTVLERLCRKVGDLRTAINASREEEKQKTLF